MTSGFPLGATGHFSDFSRRRHCDDGVSRHHDHPRSGWDIRGAVADVRTREAARSGQLVAQGHLLRVWRPPLQPGEWRTLGLFAADDGVELEEVLASMPLRVWRTDEVTPLSPHPNDPGRQTDEPGGPGPNPGSPSF
jgi:muconolactone delta-isomerase